MPNDWRCDIEQDGPRYRWVLMQGEHRKAKGGQWWRTEAEAQAAYNDFCETLDEIRDAE